MQAGQAPTAPGDKFGKWTVEEFVGIRKGGRVYRCRCECGRTHDIVNTRLLNKRTVGCVQCINEEKQRVHPDEKYGNLTVLEASIKIKSTYKAKCQCTCGRIESVSAKKLRNGTYTCCVNCVVTDRFDTSIGTVHGKWTVVEIIKLKGKTKLRCVCQCGKELTMAKAALKANRSRMCRTCSFKEREIDPSKRIWRNIVSAAKARGIEIAVSMEDALGLLKSQNYICALSNLPIYIAQSYKEFQTGVSTASLDRIDSFGPYEMGNIQWVHKKINLMKNRIPEDEFIDLCRAVAKHNEDEIPSLNTYSPQAGGMIDSSKQLAA